MILDINGTKREVAEGSTYRDLALQYQVECPHEILLAFQGNRLQELCRPVDANGGAIRFVTAADPIGMRAYRSSMTFLSLKSFQDVLGKDAVRNLIVDFSIDNGYYIHSRGRLLLTKEVLQQTEARMRELVAQDLVFEKKSVHTDDAIRKFHAEGLTDKEKLFRYRRASWMNLYQLEDYEDYYYGYLVHSTGYLKYFALQPYQNGVVLQMPSGNEPETVSEFKPMDKIFRVMMNTTEWSEKLACSNVGELNTCIEQGRVNELILVQEALMEKKIGDIAEQILQYPNKRVVLIAGPSSSGKTTFSHRLAVQMKAHGIFPHPVEVDNYFVNRTETPRDEDGNYDFEAVEALDVPLLNAHMQSLLRGEEVEMPTYNFKTGMREYRGNTLKLRSDEVLILEGIHCLNDAMSSELSADEKFKIYISALTTLNLDDHNRIPTTDGRLLRRMVRDARTRGNSAADTLNMWQKVRRGEGRNIFPYQEQADAMFNSALLYEIPVLKQYVEPLLFGIPEDDPCYPEAKRLLKFLNYFLGIDSELIPKNSIVREFIGRSVFSV